MNVYAHDRDAFNPHAIGLGEAFAGPAAVSVAPPRPSPRPSAWSPSSSRPWSAAPRSTRPWVW